MTPKLILLTEWVQTKHRGQLIRRSGQPYFDHLLTVAEMAGHFTPFGYEVGLCHDLLEKTGADAGQLYEALVTFGYAAEEARYITGGVVELTDVYTKESYPGLNKKQRKKKEAMRLTHCSGGAQTVKYADLADNISWVLQFDPGSATDYLQRKYALLLSMNAGNADLRRQVLDKIHHNKVIRK